ncbi:YoaK family protein [Sphaerisporangium aureirubrum]|uniref:YoaK family protein n=1 Tax=Sphaerisporangium aureirubrum TaxID=1544736 RepID=A0ABW1NI83_9ACTN
MGSGRGRDPLAGVLVGLTVVSGMVDAVSYLRLGNVFTANMTGNVIVFGFAAAGTPGFSVSTSAVSLAAFLVGAVVAGRAGRVSGARRTHVLVALVAEVVAVTAGLLLAAWLGTGSGARYGVVALLAVAMGVQVATVRLVALPDVTGSVLTRILAGLAAESSLAGGTNPLLVRRTAAVVCMFAGALTGALLIHAAGVPWALGAAATLLAATTVVYGAHPGSRLEE